MAPLIKRKPISKPFWALVATILIWSMSPIALVRCFQLLPQAVTSSVAVLVATATSCLFFGLTNRAVLKDALNLILFRLDPMDRKKGKTRAYFDLYFLSFMGFVLYPLFYVQGLLRAAEVAERSTAFVQGPVVVNIVNYLWPCFAVLFGWLFLHDRLTAQRGGGLLLALVGALLAVSSTTGVKVTALDYLYSGSGISISLLETGGVGFLVFALLGAIVWGLYTALLPRCNFWSSPGTEVHPASFFIALLIVGSAINILYLGARWEALLNFDYRFSFSKLGFFFLYSAGSLSTAHYLFAYVRRQDRIPLAAIAASTYFVFALGTILLYFFSSQIMTPPIAAGFALILTGAYLANDRYLSPLTGLIVFFFISYKMSAFFTPPPTALDALASQNSFFMSFLEVLTAVFSILSGFILNRAITRNFDQQQRFHQIMQEVGRISRADLAQQAKAQITTVVRAIERLYLSCVNRTDPLFFRQEEVWSELESELVQLEESLTALTPARRSEAKAMVDELRDRITHWLSIRFQGASTYEWIVLGGLVTIMALVGYRITLSEPSFLIARAAFNASMIVVILAIGDFYAGRPGKSLDFLRSSLAFLPPQFRKIDDDLVSRLKIDMRSEFIVIIAIAVIGILSLFQI